MDHVIFVLSDRLTDGSKVFGVQIGNASFDAITQGDADNLANKMRDAIQRHTNETVTVRYTASHR